MNFRLTSVILAACGLAVLDPRPACADYHLERITPILNQPTYLTQAPGDPPNIIYYTTRITTTISGFNSANSMGSVWRYDMNTRTSTAILTLSSRTIINDDGLQCIAFHPDFNTPGSGGYGKMYVSSSQQASTSLNRVEEFTVLNTNGTFKTPTEVLNSARNILRYSNNTMNNHTVDWIGFDPNAVGQSRNYLYMSTGDGSYGNAYNGGLSPTGRPSQNPNDVKGKILRVDISGPDFYPGDTNKNFDIPPDNPIPVYNASHPGTPISGLGEVYVTGVRNGYRMSFDRANSDMYWGDVGENTYEEVDFLKAGSNALGPPVDYGWPQIEGVHLSGISGAPQTTFNPFTLATSLYPLVEWTHVASGNAAIGGYVYRGPIPELQGKYFFSDYVTARIWMLNFDRNTDPATFNGANGTLTEMTFTWSTNIYDPANPSYTGDTTLATLNGLDHVVSFGEDNAGNMYIVDLGYGLAFAGQYTAQAGEIYKLVNGPIPQKLNYTQNGSNLHFTWSGNFKLQYKTNGVTSGNWADYPGGGSNQVDVAVDTLKTNVYFRLIWPP